MTGRSVHTSVWALARTQHWVITRDQLLALGYTRHAIRHRLDRGRLHVLWPNAYAVGRAELTEEGRWMAAVLTCGAGAALSHGSAAALWRIRRAVAIEVSVPIGRNPRRSGITVHRRRQAFATERCRGIPVTSPAQTVMDIAATLGQNELERVIDETDKLELATPADLRAAAEGVPGRGAKRLRDLLDRQTFVVTRSGLERRFVPLAVRAGLPLPETQAAVNGFVVDFYVRELGLVIETDGGTFHRTPAQQTRDRRRDQAHLAAGLTPLRFTHAQVRFDPDYVVKTLAAVAARSSDRNR